MKRSKKGTKFMITGAVLLSAALSLYAYNRWDDRRAGQSAAAVQDVLDVVEGEVREPHGELPADDDGEGCMPAVTIDGTQYIGTLSIPRFGLELPVIGEWDYPSLREAPCRYTGSAQTCDLVICGHNYERHFGNLKYSEPGDTVTFTDIAGNVYGYEVAEVLILQPTNVDEMITGDWDLTLFTCTIGGRTRVTVRCKLEGR